jgi:hypothetical protein
MRGNMYASKSLLSPDKLFSVSFKNNRTKYYFIESANCTSLPLQGTSGRICVATRLLTCIWELLGSNLDRDVGCSELFSGLSLSLQENARIAPR